MKVLVPKPRQRANLQEARRPTGKPVGSYLDDITALRQCVILCWRCASKFYYKRHGYYKDQRFGCVNGKCDACRQLDPAASFYVHESYLTDPNGRTPLKGGSSWIPR